ncbi:MAG: hypothetical protein IPG72_07885 [Ardenticatenales bacterium]|nr:hypothetical protein [Ardenticatenales bacterium]
MACTALSVALAMARSVPPSAPPRTRGSTWTVAAASMGRATRPAAPGLAWSST